MATLGNKLLIQGLIAVITAAMMRLSCTNRTKNAMIGAGLSVGPGTLLTLYQQLIKIPLDAFNAAAEIGKDIVKDGVEAFAKLAESLGLGFIANAMRNLNTLLDSFMITFKEYSLQIVLLLGIVYRIRR